MMIPIFLVERYGLKASGVNAIAMSSVAGLAVSVPKLIAQVDPAAAEFQAVATAQIAFAVILTSVLTPVILSFFVKRAHLQKRSTDV